jgi:hypothetical protein
MLFRRITLGYAARIIWEPGAICLWGGNVQLIKHLKCWDTTTGYKVKN